MTGNYRILLIEGSSGDAHLIKALLTEIGAGFDLEWTDSCSKGLARLAESDRAIDAVLLDLSLPDSLGFDTFTQVRTKAPKVSIIILSGLDDETMAIKAIRAGAQDYLVKGQIDGNLLARTVRYAIERRRTEDALDESERMLSALASNLLGVVYRCTNDPDRTMKYLSGKVMELTDYPAEELIRNCIHSFGFIIETEDKVRIRKEIETALAAGQSYTLEYRIRTASGEQKWVWERGSGIFSGCELLVLEGFIADITERKRMEETIRKNEEKYRDMFEKAIEGIFQMTPEGKFISVNPSLARISGFGSPEEMITNINDRGFRIFVKHEDYMKFQRILKRHGFIEKFEIQARKKNWSIIWISINGRVTKDAAGEIYHEGTIEDITRRKMIELGLRESEIKYKSLFEHANEAIFLIHYSSFVECNTKTLEMFRCGREEFIGQPPHKFLPLTQPDGSDSKKTIVQKIKAVLSGEPQCFEWEFQRMDGTLFDAEVSLGSIRLKGEVFIFSIVRDITYRKLAERALYKSESTLKSILSTSPVGIELVGFDRVVNWINYRMTFITGYRMEELLGKSMRMVYRTDEEFVRVGDVLFSEIRQGGIGTTDTQWVHKDGGLRDIHIKAAAIDPKDLSTGLVFTVVDITERTRTEEALRESENMFRDLAEKSFAGVYLIQDGVFKYVNARFAEIHSYAIEELLDRKILLDTVLPEDVSKVSSISREVKSIHNEFRIVTKQQEIKTVEIYGSRTTYRGRPAIIGTLLDITDRKRTDEKLKNLFEELEAKNSELEYAYNELKKSQQKIIQQEKMASIGQLAAGIAHEINNPVGFVMSNLNSMGKYTERLCQFIGIQSEALKNMSGHTGGAETILENVREKRRAFKVDYIADDFGNIIKESLEGTERVKRIVQDLKNFSRMDEVEQKPADINGGIESTINVVWNELKYKTDVKKEYGEIPFTKCNLGQLNQVFMNILVNAAQAIEEHGKIFVKTQQRDGYIVVSISDTGCGIPEEKLNRIFEPFFTTKEVGKGTGLGLSVAYDIVKKHNGDISVASEIGKGTTFTITIPIVDH